MLNRIKYSLAWEGSILVWLPPLKVFTAGLLGEVVEYTSVVSLVFFFAIFDSVYVAVYQSLWDRAVKYKRSWGLSAANALLYKLIAYCFTVPIASYLLNIHGSSALIMQMVSSVLVLSYGTLFKQFWKTEKDHI